MTRHIKEEKILWRRRPCACGWEKNCVDVKLFKKKCNHGVNTFDLVAFAFWLKH